MRIFICAGEPSGDLHGANLVTELRRLHPDIECVGFGGDRMEAAGCTLLYPLCQLAVMWFVRVLANIHVFLSLLSRADRYFRHQRPDAVVLIDFPGFNWWIARRAHFHGIPVFYFVPPQLWGWAGWRVEKVRKWVDHVICSLPFEVEWYRQRGITAHYLGHPYFDELPQQKLDATFLAAQRAEPGPIVGILPGSRNQEITNNLSTLFRAARFIHAARPDVRFRFACFREAQRQRVEQYLRDHDSLPVETYVGRTPEIIELSHATMAVSGSVGLELVYRGKPSVVVYRIGRLDLKVCNYFMTSPYISLVNMLAGKQVFPEFLTDRCEAQAMGTHVLRWLNDAGEYARVCAELAELRSRVAEPGACGRVARFILATLGKKTLASRAA